MPRQLEAQPEPPQQEAPQQEPPQEPQNEAPQREPSQEEPSSPVTSYIPAAVRRAVWIRDGGRCQFLREDNLCEVHARFGAMTKPLMCRMFPYVFRATPRAVTVGMRLDECVSARACWNAAPSTTWTGIP